MMGSVQGGEGSRRKEGREGPVSTTVRIESRMGSLITTDGQTKR